MTTSHHHAIDWFEIPCLDLDRAQFFYERMLGQALIRESYAGPGMQMAIFPGEGEHVVRGALCAGQQAAPLSRDGVLIYLNAGPSLTQALARVELAGGQIHAPFAVLPDGLGVIAQIIDTEGNRIGLHAER